MLVLGASGMLGNAMFRLLSMSPDKDIYGTVRRDNARSFFQDSSAGNIISGVDVESDEALNGVINQVKPDVVINCIGLVKQLEDAGNPVLAISINALLPHRLAAICAQHDARLIHFSTDCVFSGSKGNYVESDSPDAQDLYGRTKLLGEVDYPHAITLRTSIIGHEINSTHGLINWFLSQEGEVMGYTHAVFSGLPTCELARVVNEFVLPMPELHGVYHVAAAPVAKFDLLTLVNQQYGKNLLIHPSDTLKINRSLNADRFNEVTGYSAPAWPQLVASMHAFH